MGSRAPISRLTNPKCFVFLTRPPSLTLYAPIIISIMTLPGEKKTTDELQDAEKNTDACRQSRALLLSEEEALEKARSSPNDALPIQIIYAASDPDNPRNWPKWRKWYITCVVSMLNVFTYVHLSLLPSRGLSHSSHTAHGAQGAFPPVLPEYKKSLGYRLRSLLYVYLYIFLDTQSAPSFSPHSPNTLVGSRFTLYHGLVCSFSSFRWLWPQTSVLFWHVDSLQAVPEVRP